MNDKILISVIIPIYNTEEYLDRCLQSVINQTYSNLEIILVDDGSTDSSGKICDEYEKADSRVNSFHKVNGGHTSARKFGIEKSKGDYVSVIDSDDWIDLDMYASIVKELKSFDADVVVFNALKETELTSYPVNNSFDAGIYEGSKLDNLKMQICMPSGFGTLGILGMVWSKVYKRSVCESGFKRVPERITVYEDVLCSYACIFESHRILLMDIRPYHYFQRINSIMHSWQVSQEEAKLFYNTADEICLSYSNTLLMKQQVSFLKWRYMLLSCYENTATKYQNFLFPINSIHKGSRIVLYGAGALGRSMHAYIVNSGLVEIVSWVDIAYKAYDQSYNIRSPLTIGEDYYEFIVITILDENIAKNIKSNLIANGVPEEKIVYIDKSLISNFFDISF